MNSKIRCVVADDEPLARELITSYIERVERLQLTGVFSDALQLEDALQKKPADLIFLDIRMPQLSGLELLRSLRNPPRVIITTAYRQYAVEGFDLDVLDYLVKPISFERFLKAIGKFTAPAAPEELRTLDVSVKRRLMKIPLDEILLLESRRDHCIITTREKEIVVRETISNLAQLLSRDFIRIHRSFIVNSRYISSSSSGEVEISGRLIPVGRLYRENLRQLR